MKQLLLIWLFSGSLDSFSQDTASHRTPKPDTLRAIVLVTTTPNSIARARMGYVVIAEGRKPVYLTCDKKALKLPQVGWGYEVVGKEGRR